MSKTLESVFASEFRREVSNIGYKDIYKIPLPDECSNWYVSGTELYAVKGINQAYYSLLNNSILRKVPRAFDIKRRVIDKVSRGYAKNPDGSYLYEDFSIPSGSIAVLSEKVINLPYSEYKKKVDKEGYGYVDLISFSGKTEYIYVLPKSVLYKVNQTALALSVTNMKNYAGSGYMTWNNGTIFLHIIPYNPNSKYSGSRILKTGYSLNYRNEINVLLNYWQDINGVNLIPNISLCALSDGSNLVLKGTTVGYDSYSPVESLALSDKEIYGVEVQEGCNNV